MRQENKNCIPGINKAEFFRTLNNIHLKNWSDRPSGSGKKLKRRRKLKVDGRGEHNHHVFEEQLKKNPKIFPI